MFLLLYLLLLYYHYLIIAYVMQLQCAYTAEVANQSSMKS